MILYLITHSTIKKVKNMFRQYVLSIIHLNYTILFTPLEFKRTFSIGVKLSMIKAKV